MKGKNGRVFKYISNDVYSSFEEAKEALVKHLKSTRNIFNVEIEKADIAIKEAENLKEECVNEYMKKTS